MISRDDSLVLCCPRVHFPSSKPSCNTKLSLFYISHSTFPSATLDLSLSFSPHPVMSPSRSLSYSVRSSISLPSSRSISFFSCSSVDSLGLWYLFLLPHRTLAHFILSFFCVSSSCYNFLGDIFPSLRDIFSYFLLPSSLGFLPRCRPSSPPSARQLRTA